ncbi:hypothetical protein E2C01_014443 [Portunus trituberculatus]|uniref:Uncharacterized protein n=1 Tax=Portunus trituberculatus TaxID=210409 RepID=A0A5B7DK20_PORTR|nr:hypothetical protein [Portunus trituberculatus]
MEKQKQARSSRVYQRSIGEHHQHVHGLLHTPILGQLLSSGDLLIAGCGVVHLHLDEPPSIRDDVVVLR